MHAPQRDLASVEVWDRSLERSRRRRVLAAQGRREVARRKQAAAAAAAGMVVSPSAAAFAAAGSGSGAGSGVATASAANRAIAPGAPSRLLRLGTTGPDVIRIQTALGQTPDGVFGPRTLAAVRTFQGRNGLLVDGIVGPKTWGTLFGPHGASYDPATPRYQFKIQRASAVEEARVRPALAGKGPVAKIVLRTTPAVDSSPAGGGSHHQANSNTVPAVDHSTPAPHASPPRSSAPVSTSCGSSRIVAPVRGYTVTGDFGEQRPGHIHAGMDLAVAYGTPIVAAACGIVTTASAQGGYGNMVCVKHSSSLTTCYAHMSRFASRVGQTVHQGQVIGYVGCTGSCTGPHVHFETRVNGRPVDPAPYLSGSRRARVTTVHASSSKSSRSTKSARVRSASSASSSSSAARVRSAGGSGGTSSASGPGTGGGQSSAQTVEPAAQPAATPEPQAAPAPAPAPAAQAAPAPAPAPAAQAAPAPAPEPAPAAAPAPAAQAAPAPAAQAAPAAAPAPAPAPAATPAPAADPVPAPAAAPAPAPEPAPAAQAAPAPEPAPAAVQQAPAASSQQAAPPAEPAAPQAPAPPATASAAK